jgi:hypothetical protein
VRDQPGVALAKTGPPTHSHAIRAGPTIRVPRPCAVPLSESLIPAQSCGQDATECRGTAWGCRGARLLWGARRLSESARAMTADSLPAVGLPVRPALHSRAAARRGCGTVTATCGRAGLSRSRVCGPVYVTGPGVRRARSQSS